MRKGAKFVLVIVALAGFTAVGAFVFWSLNSRNTLQDQPVVVDKLSSPSVSSNSDSWKGIICSQAVGSVNQTGEYQNRQMGISVKTPHNWKLKEYCHGAQVYQITFEAPDNGEPISRDPSCLPCSYFVREFQVSVSENKDVSDLESLKRFITGRFDFNKNLTKINLKSHGGIEGYEVTGLVGSGVKNFFMFRGNKIYTIAHLEYIESSDVENPKYSGLFENFLASFRLI